MYRSYVTFRILNKKGKKIISYLGWTPRLICTRKCTYYHGWRASPCLSKAPLISPLHQYQPWYHNLIGKEEKKSAPGSRVPYSCNLKISSSRYLSFTPRSACPTDIHVVTKDAEFEFEQTFWFYEQMKLSSQILTWIYPKNVLSMFFMFWCSYVLPELCGF